jgi:hypothetical protein
MSRIYLPSNASKARQKDAERARQNRAEIVRELSWGRVSRRDLIKWGLFTGAGMLAPIGGLNPFVRSASASGLDPTGMPRSPLFSARPFTQPMPRFDVLPRMDPSCLSPAPQAQANETLAPVHVNLGGGYGPIEGRPPGTVWAHQRWAEYAPTVACEATQAPATTNYSYNPQVPSRLNSDRSSQVSRHASIEAAVRTEPVWTFSNDSPKLVQQVRRAAPVPTTTGCRPTSCRTGVRAPHDLDARAQQPSRGGERS